MDNNLSFGKRIATAFVAAATILSTLGVAGFALPSQASAASAGDLIRGNSFSDVYYYAADGMRYVFPNVDTYMTWYNDFSGVDFVSDSTISNIEIGGNVVVRPGTEWIKIVSDARTYAVSTNGMIHWIESEAVATDFAGSNWNEGIIDVADVFFANYTAGASLQSATAFDGMLYTMDGNEYVAWGGEARMVTSSGMSGNQLKAEYFLDGEGMDVSSLSTGSDVTGYECELSDASQSGCTEVPMGGDVTVSLASSTPAGALLPKAANSVEVLRFNVMAGSEDSTFSQVALKMNAIGATSNIDKVYLYEGSERLTSGRTINSSTRKVTFGSLGLDLDAGQTRTISVRVALSASANAADALSLQIASSSDLEAAGGDVMGSFPISGNTFTIANDSVGSLTVAKTGTIENPVVGEQDATIGKFRVTAGSQEDINLEEVTLKIDDSGDHADYKLWNDSTLLATGVALEDDLVSFALSSALAVEKGDSETLEVSADIGGEAADAIKVYVDDAVDVLATGADYGFGVTVTRTAYDGDSCTTTAGDCSYSTIDGGDITLTSNNLASTDVQVDGEDQVFMDFSITTVQDLEVNSIKFNLEADDNQNGNFGESGEDAYADLSLARLVNVDTGLTVAGPEELTNASPDTVTFDSGFSLEAGESLHLQLVADIDSTVSADTDYRATLVTSAIDADGADGEQIDASTIVPSSSLVGQTVTAQSASLEVALSSNAIDFTTVQNAKDRTVNVFEFQAGDAADVTIHDVTANIYAHDASTGTYELGDCDSSGECATNDITVSQYVESCSLYADDTRIAGPKSPSSNGENLVYTGVNWTVAEGDAELLEIRCDFRPASTTVNAYLAFDIDPDNVRVEDENDNTVTFTGSAVNGGTTPSAVVTVEDKGSVSVSKDSSAPTADFILSGTSDNLVNILRFGSDYEDVEITEIRLKEAQATADAGTTSNAYSDNISSLTIAYTNSAGESVEKSASVTGADATARFTNIDLLVDQYSDERVYVYADTQNHARKSGGADSNDRLRIEFLATGFDGEGADSSAAFAAADVSTTTNAPMFVVREAAPTIELNALSPSGTGYVAGTNDVLIFDVTASGDEDIVIDHLVLDVDTSDVDSGTWMYCDLAGSKIVAADFELSDESEALDDYYTATLLASDGLGCDTSAGSNAGEKVEFVKFSFGTEYVIPAGSSEQFTLSMDTSGAAANDSVQVNIPSDLWVNSTWADASVNVGTAAAYNATTLDFTSATLADGAIVCLSTDTDCADATDEIVLVVDASTAASTTVVRGYRGTTQRALTTSDNLLVTGTPHTSFLWQDDGSLSTSGTDEYWGAYLVEELTVSGRPLQF